ncbi:hypothetical protein [Bacillus thuringiensis]|uniref:hypothetical protein n=1 Tax=Bacillus thuringiensis TaxID=1428 RepID=UPI00159707E7|nr:hypothetical protein [Bacillus thuringiensis]
MDKLLQLFVNHGYEIGTFLLAYVAIEFEFEYINENGKKTRKIRIASRFMKK